VLCVRTVTWFLLFHVVMLNWWHRTIFLKIVSLLNNCNNLRYKNIFLKCTKFRSSFHFVRCKRHDFRHLDFSIKAPFNFTPSPFTVTVSQTQMQVFWSPYMKWRTWRWMWPSCSNFRPAIITNGTCWELNAHPASYLMRTAWSCPGAKAAGAWSWLLTSI